MEAKTYYYEIIITANSKVRLMPEEGRELSGMNLHADFDGDSLMINDDGLTPLGYKAIVNVLCSAISEHARAATESGIHEGEVIRDAINILKSNLIDATRKPPKAKTKGKRRQHRRKDKPQGW